MPRPIETQFKLALEGTMALTYFGLGVVCLLFASETSQMLGLPMGFVYALAILLALYGGFRGWRFFKELRMR
jgi:hypothetical protein